MKIIGITGGVGAGKSQVLSYIKDNYSCEILLADQVAHLLEEPGQKCYEQLVKLMGTEILTPEGTIHKAEMAKIIFSNPDILKKVNQIVHPEVKKYIIEYIEQAKLEKKVQYFFIEAALLIEEHYDEIVDEMWYIHADVTVRTQRLKAARNYSDEKIADIIRGQLSEAEFREHCDVVIVNNGNLEDTYQQINHQLLR